MRIIGIDADESIRSMKLIFPRTREDKQSDRAFYAGISFVLFISVLLLVLNTDLEQTGDKIAVIIVLVLLLSAAGYAIYCKLTEKILTVMHVPYDKLIIRKKLLGFANERKMKTKRSSSYALQLLEKNTYLYTFDKTHVFIIRDNMIFYTALREDTYVPVMGGRREMEHTMKLLFKKEI